MFQGHSICNIDAKSRLVLPSKFRKYIKAEANNRIVLTRGFEECILVYPLDAWEKLTKGFSNYNVFNSQQRSFMRRFMMYVNDCDIDPQNRILLPSQLIEFAHIKKEILILGMLDKIEIWDPETKDKYDEMQPESYEEVAQKVSEEIINNINTDKSNTYKSNTDK